jgi:hypothetical protein
MNDHETISVGVSTVTGVARFLLQPTTVVIADSFTPDPAVPWHNPVLAQDVTCDGQVTPQDALTIINEINSGASGALPTPLALAFSPPPYLDVTRDGILSPADVLDVINWLNARTAAGTPSGNSSSEVQAMKAVSPDTLRGEGEFAWPAAALRPSPNEFLSIWNSSTTAPTRSVRPAPWSPLVPSAGEVNELFRFSSERLGFLTTPAAESAPRSAARDAFLSPVELDELPDALGPCGWGQVNGTSRIVDGVGGLQ